VSPSRTRAFFWLLALLVIALFTRLGFWQLARMHEKQAMLVAAHAVVQQRHALPLAIAADPRRMRDFDWSAGSGHFTAAPAVLLDNQARDGRAGVRVYRVFQPDHVQPDAASPLLVDLGWLPLPGNRQLPAIGLPQGTRRIAGLLAPPPSPGLVASILQPQADGSLLATRIDADALRAQLHLAALAPRVLRLDPKLAGGYARDLDVLPNTLPPSRHLGYAVQWFGLALTVLATALLLTFRKSRPRKPHKSP